MFNVPYNNQQFLSQPTIGATFAPVPPQQVAGNNNYHADSSPSSSSFSAWLFNLAGKYNQQLPPEVIQILEKNFFNQTNFLFLDKEVLLELQIPVGTRVSLLKIIEGEKQHQQRQSQGAINSSMIRVQQQPSNQQQFFNHNNHAENTRNDASQLRLHPRLAELFRCPYNSIDWIEPPTDTELREKLVEYWNGVDPWQRTICDRCTRWSVKVSKDWKPRYFSHLSSQCAVWNEDGSRYDPQRSNKQRTQTNSNNNNNNADVTGGLFAFKESGQRRQREEGEETKDERQMNSNDRHNTNDSKITNDGSLLSIVQQLVDDQLPKKVYHRCPFHDNDQVPHLPSECSLNPANTDRYPGAADAAKLLQKYRGYRDKRLLEKVRQNRNENNGRGMK